MTKTDFSFLKTSVVIGSFVALGAIIVFTIFGINPGALFSIAMIVLMSAAILWQTWQVKDQCSPDQHVGAATIIFAGFMTLLWYVIQLFLSRRS
jgi:FtsH-binding integral membrane protein